MSGTVTTARPGRSTGTGVARTLALGGAVAFAALFAFRAVSPVDAILLPIAIALVAATGAVVVGYRLAGWFYLVFPIALFASPASRELAFNLSAVDSVAWRWYGVVSLVTLGLGTAAAMTVGLRGRPSAPSTDEPRTEPPDPTPPWSVAAVGGLALGLAFLVLAPAVADHPGFGRDLSHAELAALPTIDLLNDRYDPGVVTIDRSGTHRFRLDNPTDVPHTVTIDAIDLEVWVPARRWSVIEFDAGELPETVAFHCSVGEHRQRGMSGVLEVVS